MKIFIRTLTIITLLFAFHTSKAQYVEFVENKGQWDSRIKFTGELNNGYVLLQQDGYQVLLNNPQDLQNLYDYYGGHKERTNGVKTEDHSLSDPVNVTGMDGGTNTKKLILRSHMYEVKFVGANPNPQIVPDKAMSSVNNYFIGNDPSKWASGCALYQAVVYKNLYPNIDVRYYTDNSKLKYDFIINPGGDPSKIVMQFDGADALNLKYGNLIVKTSVGDVTELAPVSYQFNVKERTTVKAQFVVKGNTVRFKLDNYSKDLPLIIDPSLIFSTFSGSKADNWGYTATYDGQGNFYMAGIAFGRPTNGFPASPGAFQTSFQGGVQEGSLTPYDIGIIKLTPDGSQRVYATYLGGSGNEQPHSLVVDNNGDLIIAGRTNSSDFPQTMETYGKGGGFDIFLTKFNPTGSALLGSRKIGGSGDDGVNIRPKWVGATGAIDTRRNYGDDARSEVITDAANNIYLASCTQSTDYPVSPGTFQSTSGGEQDAVVIKASSNLSNILFSSYLGGKGQDAAFVLALNPANNNIYVAGGTTSTDFPGIASGVLYTSYQGGVCDGFVSIISNDGKSLIRTSYFGTGGNEVIYGVQFDKFAFPYIMGTTTGAWPVVNAAYKQDNGKQFISKLKPDLSGWEYSTVFGKGQASPDISPTAFLVDRCENVYVSGWGGVFENSQGYPNSNTTNLSVTPNAIQKTTDGNDFYFFVLERNATSQLYGSYFGERGGFGDHVDGGTSRFDRQGVIYQAICANCNKEGVFPTTPGVWSPDNPSTEAARCNLAGIKIAFELAGVGAGLQASIEGVPRDTSGCIPLTVDFKDTLGLGKTYKWDFGDGSPEQTTTNPAISHTYTQIGDYRVRLISIDSSTCNIADTSYTHIRARSDRAVLGMSFAKLPPCESLSYQFNNTSTAPAGKPFNAQSFMWDFGDGATSTETNPVHTYAATGTYIVKLKLLDTAYCNAPDELDTTLRIAPNVKAQFETPTFGCAPYTAVFNNTSEAGQTFTWDFGDGTTSTETSPTHVYKIPGNYTVKLVAVDPSTCNHIDSTSLTIVVSEKPTANFSFTPQPSQENTFTTFINNSIGATGYKWDFGDGEELVTSKKDTTIKHIFGKSGMYNVCLIASNQYGCIDTFCSPVQAIIVPVVDVANAFTPNGDGVNDVVTVQGFGITRMNWKIYNRWGALVFQSTSQKMPWDGKYKGVLQPQEVYAYVLDVEFSDGTKYQKKGDITLLR